MKYHGMSVGVQRVEDNVYMHISIEGKLTHADYQVITPMLDNAVAAVEHAKINILIDARKFEGWELEAMWDDFKLGMKHLTEFEKIAIVGNKHWEKMLVKVGGWFISGETHFFEDYDEASDWLC